MISVGTTQHTHNGFLTALPKTLSVLAPANQPSRNKSLLRLLRTGYLQEVTNGNAIAML